MTERHASEHEEQAALFRQLGYKAQQYPELALALAIPNGGLRSAATAGKLKAEGVKPGVPDVFLPVGRWYPEQEHYNGLWLEMKVGKNRPTELQKWWHERLTEQGYAVYVCYSWIEAWNRVVEYLGLPSSEMLR